jgi:hypothetical protein
VTGLATQRLASRGLSAVGGGPQRSAQPTSPQCHQQARLGEGELQWCVGGVLDGVDEAGAVGVDVVDVAGDRSYLHRRDRDSVEELGGLVGIGEARVEPVSDTLGREDERDAVVDLPAGLVASVVTDASALAGLAPAPGFLQLLNLIRLLQQRLCALQLVLQCRDLFPRASFRPQRLRWSC